MKIEGYEIDTRTARCVTDTEIVVKSAKRCVWFAFHRIDDALGARWLVTAHRTRVDAFADCIR